MSDRQMFALLQNFWSDLHYPMTYWLVLALTIILTVSWGFSYRLRVRDDGRDNSARSSLKAFGAGGIKRVAFPLIAWVLVLVLQKTLVAMQWAHLSLLYLAAPLLVAWALVRVLVYALRCVFSSGGFLTSFERLISTAVWSVLVLDLTGLAEPLIETLEQIKFAIGNQNLDLWMVLHGSVTVALTLLLALWIASLIENHLREADQMDPNLRVVLARVAKAVLSLIALLLSLSLLGIDVTTLSVFGGALAVGLGIGLQKIASNYVSGFIILLDRSIRIGNLIAVDDKIFGTVTQITTRYTVMKMLTGTEVIVPNEHLVSNIVRNLSFSDPRVRVTVSVQVAYSSDLERAMQLMVDSARQHDRVLGDPEPVALITEFADSGINLEIGFWVADPEKGTGSVRSDISLLIWKSFRANSIEIPFPQRELRILGSALAA